LDRFIVTRDGSHSLFSPQYEQQYHSLHGALNEAVHIYINLGLRPILENATAPVHVFEMGFGTGLNAFLAWKLADELGKQIYYTSVEAFPVTSGEASLLNYETLTGQSGFMELHDCPWSTQNAISDFFSFQKENNVGDPVGDPGWQILSPRRFLMLFSMTHLIPVPSRSCGPQKYSQK
jgi:hypothetical protein